MSIIMLKQETDSIGLLVEHLSHHRLAIIPCDTIYGIVGSVPDTEKALRMVKGREETKPFIQLVTMDMVKMITKEPLDPLVFSYWPGPLTVIVNNWEGSTTAIRVPADPFLQTVLESLGTPIYSTSVNISGEKAFVQFEEMVARFGDVIPLFVKGDDDQGTIPSTIIDVTKRPYTLLRQGAVDVSDLLHTV